MRAPSVRMRNSASSKDEPVIWTRPAAAPGTLYGALLPICLLSSYFSQRAARDSAVMQTFLISALLFLWTLLEANKTSHWIFSYLQRRLVAFGLIMACVSGDMDFSAALLVGVVGYLILMKEFSSPPVAGNFSIGERSLVSQGFALFLGSCVKNALSFSRMDFGRSGHPKKGKEMWEVNTISQIIGCLVLVTLSFTRLLGKSALRNSFFLLSLMAGVIISWVFIESRVLHGSLIVWFMDIMMNMPEKVQILKLWTGLLVSTVGFAIASGLLKSSKRSATQTIERKLFHVAISLVFILGARMDPLLLHLASSLLFWAFLVAEALRVLNVWPFSGILNAAFRTFLDEKDLSGPLTLTNIYLLVGCAAPLWLSTITSSHRPLAELNPFTLLAGVLSVGFGDTAASVGGSLFGSRKWQGSNKSVEGSICCSFAQIGVVCLLSCVGFEVLEHDVGIIMTSIFLSTIMEAKTDQVDNLVLPLLSYAILDNDLQKDANRLAEFVRKDSWKFSICTANLLRRLGEKSPVSWQLVCVLHKIIVTSEMARIKFCENKYLMGILARFFNSPEWPAVELKSLADTLAVMSLDVKLTANDYVAEALATAALNRIYTHDDDEGEAIQCSSGILLIHCLQACPSLVALGKTLDLVKCLSGVRTPLGVHLRTVLGHVFGFGNIRDVPCDEMWNECRSSKTYSDWSTLKVTSFLVEFFAEDLNVDFLKWFKDLNWNHLHVLSLKSILRFLMKIPGKSYEENLLLWGIACKAVLHPCLVGYGFSLAAASFPELSEADIKIDIATVLAVLADVLDVEYEGPDECVLSGLNFLEIFCSNDEKLGGHAKMISCILCYVGPKKIVTMLKNVAFDAHATDGSGRSQNASAIVARTLALCLKNFCRMDDWKNAMLKIAEDGVVIPGVKAAFFDPLDLPTFQNAIFAMQWFIQHNSADKLYDHWKLASFPTMSKLDLPGSCVGCSGGSKEISPSSSMISCASGDSAIHSDDHRNNDVLQIIKVYESKIRNMKIENDALRGRMRSLQDCLDDRQLLESMRVDETLEFRMLLRENLVKLEAAERNINASQQKFKDKLSQERVEAEKKQETLRKEMASMSEFSSRLEARILAVEKDLESSDAARKALLKQLDENQAEKSKLLENLKIQSDKCLELSECLKRAEKKIENQASKLKSSKEENSDLQANIASLTARFDESSAEMCSIEDGESVVPRKKSRLSNELSLSQVDGSRNPLSHIFTQCHSEPQVPLNEREFSPVRRLSFPQSLDMDVADDKEHTELRLKMLFYTFKLEIAHPEGNLELILHSGRDLDVITTCFNISLPPQPKTSWLDVDRSVSEDLLRRILAVRNELPGSRFRAHCVDAETGRIKSLDRMTYVRALYLDYVSLARAVKGIAGLLSLREYQELLVGFLCDPEFLDGDFGLSGELLRTCEALSKPRPAAREGSQHCSTWRGRGVALALGARAPESPCASPHACLKTGIPSVARDGP
ncbi:unnamed protein product [Notodromas monacha]|uniref:dolichol kinase n=1 Tax=Notodromas monacha TaxID=399045 RepID=A0A7R9G9M4_9CRUS|nr:unnamed protein product [Notodromas monacha]CAG0913043.1 unnamed protein product [Notodromas monacha]